MKFNFIFLTLYLGLLYFEPQQFVSFLEKIRITYLFGLFGLVWGFISSPTYIKQNLFKSKLFILISAFILLNIFSLLFSNFPIVDQYDELFKAFSLTLIIIFFIRSERDLKKFYWLLIIFTTLNAGFTIHYYIRGMLPTRMLSYFGSLGQSGSNEFALLMLQFIPFSVLLVQDKYRTKNEKLFMIFSFLILLYCLTRTGSRAGFLGLIIIMITITLFGYLKPKYLVFVIILLVFVFSKSPSSYFTRAFTSFSEETYEEDSNITSRFEQYRTALEVVKKYPLFGVGMNNYQKYIYLNLSDYSVDQKIYQVHNAYISIAAENGILALLLFIILIVYMIYKFGEYKKKLTQENSTNLVSLFFGASQVSLVAYAWMAMTLGVQFQRVFYIMIALAISAPLVIPELIDDQLSTESY